MNTEALTTAIKAMANNQTLNSFTRAKHWVVFLYMPDRAEIVAYDAADPVKLIQAFREPATLVDILGVPNSTVAQAMRNNFNNVVKAYEEYRAKVNGTVSWPGSSMATPAATRPDNKTT